MPLPDLTQTNFTRDDIAALLDATDPAEIQAIQAMAEQVLLAECGDRVFMRGLIEASNICTCDCAYCGIRKSNKNVRRFQVEEDDILAVAHESIALGYGSMVIQTGERRDPRFVDEIESALRRIKTETRCDALPDGLGITLSVGEQSEETYCRFFEAGAHRYLLRIETTNPSLFARIHPASQKFEDRVACLESLCRIGYQVGTGVMIGLPGQTTDDLAGDVLFFKEHDIDMIGMGPFIPHAETPLGSEPCPSTPDRVRLGLLMIAATRLVLRDVNIAATTALQALDPEGRVKALHFGANVMMPLLTPTNVRQDYLLYPGKPSLDQDSSHLHAQLEAHIRSAGRTLGKDAWGDSPHAKKKRLNG